MTAKPQRHYFVLRPGHAAEGALAASAARAPIPAAAYLRRAALAGHTFAEAGFRILEDGKLLVPVKGQWLQVTPAMVAAAVGAPVGVPPPASPAPRAQAPAPPPAKHSAGHKPALGAATHSEPRTESASEEDGSADQNAIADQAMRSLGL